MSRHKEYGLAFDIDPKDLTDAAEFGRRARALQMSAQALIEKHTLGVIEPVRFTVRLRTGMDA